MLYCTTPKLQFQTKNITRTWMYMKQCSAAIGYLFTYYNSQVSTFLLLRLMFYLTNVLQVKFTVCKINISNVINFPPFFETEMQPTTLFFVPRCAYIRIILFIYF